MGLQEMCLDEITHDIQVAAQQVADDWAELFTVEELETDLSLRLLDEELALDLSFMPPETRHRYLVSMARDTASKALAELAHYSNRSIYSVSSIKGHLDAGRLTLPRDRFNEVAVDLDQGCRYLAYVLPGYAMTLADRYYRDVPVDDTELTRAIQALTNCVNNLHRAPRKVLP